MSAITRRQQIKSLLGLAAAPLLAQAPRPPAPRVPPAGIGRRIRHVSYSDVCTSATCSATG
jgi:hypothetical protein